MTDLKEDSIENEIIAKEDEEVKENNDVVEEKEGSNLPREILTGILGSIPLTGKVSTKDIEKALSRLDYEIEKTEVGISSL